MCLILLVEKYVYIGSIVYREIKNTSVSEYLDLDFSVFDTFQDPRRPELRGALPIEVIRCWAVNFRHFWSQPGSRA